MQFELTQEILRYLDDSYDEMVALLEELCKIPAPSWHEERRAEFCKKWLEDNGAEGVYIDEALNVIYPVGCENAEDVIVYMAHTDTVFPDTEYPMPFSTDGEYAYAPGVGDDAACLVCLLMAARYVARNKLKPSCGILFAANAGEEGLGNLKGCRQIMKDYGDRVREVYTADGLFTKVEDRCVGSHRYQITFETEGGHSFSKFGRRNAIHAMSQLICRLYQKQVPVAEGTKTTYNVGVVEGGTSVNTIAQRASMLYEYRSDDHVFLEEMKAFFEEEIAHAREDQDVKITVETVGIRPCAKDVDPERLRAMTEKVMRISEKYSGMPCAASTASTDANIPLSMGIPAICFGAYLGEGAHTREEKILLSSLRAGMKIVAEVALEHFFD